MSLSPQDLDYEEAHVHDNHAYQLIVPLAIFGFIAFSCVILRPVARHLSGTFLWLDDWLIIASMFCGTGLVITACLTTTYGVGRHIIAVAPKDLTKFAKVNFAVTLFYPPTLVLAKLSILALYARIFTMKTRLFAIAVYTVAVWIILWFIGSYLSILLECRPVSSYWTSGCELKYRTTLVTSVLNIMSDLMVLALPSWHIWKLQISMRQKVGVAMLLGLGVIATAMSIARVSILGAEAHQNSPDFTYIFINIYVFTVCEPLIGIICACLPILQKPLRNSRGSILGLSGLRSLLRSDREKARIPSDSMIDDQSAVNGNYTEATNRTSKEREIHYHESFDSHLPIVERHVV